MNKSEILTQALEAREQEVFMYQVNIDNYTLALEEIASANDAELEDFRVKLEGLLTSERLEQKKANIMLAVIKKQME